MNIHISGERGMTLVELIVTLAIIGVIMLPISLMLYVGYQSSFTENEATIANEQARTAMDRMMNDLRKYDFDNSSYNEKGVLNKHVKDNQLIINDDLVYSYDNEGNLSRNDQVICQQVSYFTAREYYDGTSSNIIEITLAVQPKNISDPVKPIELKDSYWRRIPANK